MRTRRKINKILEFFIENKVLSSYKDWCVKLVKTKKYMYKGDLLLKEIVYIWIPINLWEGMKDVNYPPL